MERSSNESKITIAIDRGIRTDHSPGSCPLSRSAGARIWTKLVALLCAGKYCAYLAGEPCDIEHSAIVMVLIVWGPINLTFPYILDDWVLYTAKTLPHAVHFFMLLLKLFYSYKSLSKLNLSTKLAFQRSSCLRWACWSSCCWSWIHWNMKQLSGLLKGILLEQLLNKLKKINKTI